MTIGTQTLINYIKDSGSAGVRCEIQHTEGGDRESKNKLTTRVAETVSSSIKKEPWLKI